MIDLASIRNASFSLTPTGYNPEEVDRFLADLADQLAEPSAFAAAAVAVQPEPQMPVIEQLEPAVSEAAVADRAPADLDCLQRAVERTIDAMDSFVQTELAAVREASSLEVDEIHRERERLLEEAGAAARSHLDETRVRAEQMMQDARNEGAELRRRFESEIQSERERFEHMLSEREAEAHARASEIVAAAEDRRREADQLVANAGRVQTEVLASIEQARASLELTTTTISVPAERSTMPSWNPEAAPQDDTEGAGEREDGSPTFRQDEGRSSVSLQSLLFDARSPQPAGESEPSAEAPADDAGDAADAAA
jgi:DivIVA domain-containing protein